MKADHNTAEIRFGFAAKHLCVNHLAVWQNKAALEAAFEAGWAELNIS